MPVETAVLLGATVFNFILAMSALIKSSKCKLKCGCISCESETEYKDTPQSSTNNVCEHDNEK